LPVNPYAELSTAVALERFKLISWRRAQIIKTHRRIEHIKLTRCYRLKGSPPTWADAIQEESLSGPISEAPDHALLCGT
jgi:hypothetical protein